MANQFTFKTFLVTENTDVEATSGETLDAELSPTQQADDLAGLDTDPEAAGAPLDLDTDERFLDLSPIEQRRIRVFARNMSPPEVEEELQSTWERTSGSQGGTFGTDDVAGLDADMDGSEVAGGNVEPNQFDDPMDSEPADDFGDVEVSDEYAEDDMADNQIAMPKRMAPQPRAFGESFLSSLLKI